MTRNCKKKEKKPQVSFDTAGITVRYGYYPRRVTVYAGAGAVWENPTRGIPVGNPIYAAIF
jgi:hypothetical protein